jgi:hypothetical protein
MKKCYVESRRRGMLYRQQKEGRLFGLVSSCMGEEKDSKLKAETLDHTVRRTGFGRGCGPVVREITE